MFRKRIQTILFVSLFSLMIFGISWAGSFTDISTQSLKDRLESGEKILVVNPLSDLEFDEQHIPGSVNIPLHLISTTDKLPEDKATPIVTYCLGPK